MIDILYRKHIVLNRKRFGGFLTKNNIFIKIANIFNTVHTYTFVNCNILIGQLYRLHDFD